MAGGIIERSELQAPTPTDEPGLIPVVFAKEIIQEATKQSLALSTFRQIPIPTKVNSLPVLDVLPQAAWVTGEPGSDGTGGEKGATDQLWKGAVLVAEEIAAIVPIPEAIIEDAGVDLWAEITPRIGESIGAAVDRAAFGGIGKPSSWPNGIIPDATTAGHVVTVGTSTDPDSYSEAFGMVEDDGFMVNAVYAALNQKAAFRGFSAAGVPIYVSDVRDDGRVDSIYGVTVTYDQFGALATSPATYAVVGDPTKAIIGTRVDMQYKWLDQATITLPGGGTINLAEQDTIALRVRARFGFVVANPVTHANPDKATRYPFAVIQSSTLKASKAKS